MTGMPERRTAGVISFVLVALAVLSIVVAVSFVLGGQDPNAASVAAGAVSLDEAIDGFDPNANQPDLSEIDAPARDLLAGAQLLEVGDPNRALAIEAAGGVLDVERSLSDALAYQAGLVVYVGRPALPTAADELSDVTETFTGWLTSFADVADPVPAGAAFTDHARLVSEFLESVPTTQAQYFDALRSGDSESAAAALQVLDNSVSALEQSVQNAVMGARTNAGAGLERAQAMLPRITIEE
jgi:hypothetical protein